MAASVLQALLAAVLLSVCGSTAADTLSNNLVASSCSANYIAGNETFQANLNTLLSTLKARASISLFYNATAGDGADRVYGLHMCEGDMSAADCRTCIATAATGILQSCPSSRDAVIWYDYCQLRFAGYNFFGVMEASGQSSTNPFAQVYNPSLPLGMLSRLVEDAPTRSPKFAANASVTAGVYALAQCTDDLSSGDCRSCLEAALQSLRNCCSSAQGYRYLTPSCWVRYEATPFLRKLNSTYTSIIVPRCRNDSFSDLDGRVNNSKSTLGILLSSLASDAPRSGGFATGTAGDGPAASRLYGLALCRGDLANSNATCRGCLTDARSSMLQMCPQKVEGTVWYEQCQLRYSNESFFGAADTAGRHFCGVEDTSQDIDAASLNMMSTLVEGAPDQPLMFAAGSTVVNESASSYGFVQCTRDLGGGDCRSCLRGGIAIVSARCPRKRGWRYLSGSCNLRYESFAFFDVSVGSVVVPYAGGTNGSASDAGKGGTSKTSIIAITVPIIVGVILLGSVYLIMLKRKRTRHQFGGQPKIYLNDLETLEDTDLHLVDLGTIKEVTNDFSEINKIGQGGFGTVYKGTMKGGEEIAIKRLSAGSNQGTEEFKNEVILISKLQHRNLLRILGCCIEGEEKMLIYEYMRNGSLDTFIFDQTNRASLEWKSRVDIIVGIARGLLYLHEDSELKIIHRDIKPSNVLLDSDMNPKISDFGMAKIYRGALDSASMGRVVGTYGYMAPEYAMNGVFSSKSDVFSFGVLVLEILSGQKNGRSHYLEHGLTLPRRAWQLWTEGSGFQLVDSLIAHLFPVQEALKCTHIGLLCVQDDPERRPTMSHVMLMLMSDQMVLPEPSPPPSFAREVADSTTNRRSPEIGSVNVTTITTLLPR